MPDEKDSQLNGTMLWKFGKPKEDDNTNNKAIDLITRTAMRNPSKEVHQMLCVLHERIKQSFSGMSDEALQWLITGSRIGRGGFKDVNSFREFLAKSPNDISSSRLISGLESITTCMGYRTIFAFWVHPPFNPETTEQKKISNVLQDMVRPYIVPKIETTYSLRTSDLSREVRDPDNIITRPRRLSDASDVDYDEEKQPPESLGEIRYVEVEKTFEYSWVSAAVEGGVSVRGHVSGTAPLGLAACAGLFKTADPIVQDWFQDDDNLRKFSGTIVLPTYHRGDFHSLAETYAGVEHFIAYRAGKPSVPIQPQTALEGALKWMSSSISEEIKDGYSTSAKQVVEAEIPSIMAETRFVPARMTTPDSSNIDFSEIALNQIINAIKNGETTTAMSMIKDNNFAINQRLSDSSGDTFIIEAARNGHFKLVQELQKEGANPNRTNNRGLNAIVWMCAYMARRCANEIKAEGINDIHHHLKHKLNFFTALLNEARDYPNNSPQRLFNNVIKTYVGEDITSDEFSLAQVLTEDFLSEESMAHDVLIKILNIDLNPVVKDLKGQLIDLVENGKTSEAISLIQRNKFPINQRLNEDGDTLVLLAARKGNFDAVKELQSQGANLNQQANNGFNAIAQMCQYMVNRYENDLKITFQKPGLNTKRIIHTLDFFNALKEEAVKFPGKSAQELYDGVIEENNYDNKFSLDQVFAKGFFSKSSMTHDLLTNTMSIDTRMEPKASKESEARLRM